MSDTVAPGRTRMDLSVDLDTTWMEAGACRGVDPDLFFPQDGQKASHARGACAPCPVRSQCLDFAMATDQMFGIWGGLNVKERRALRRARAA